MAPESVRHSNLINQLVLNRSTMDELGRVEVLWEYPQAHRVLGFICKSGPFDRVKTAFNLDQVDTIGENGIFVNSDPVETDAERVQQIESLISSEVWTDMGKQLGRIHDHVFDLKTGVVKYYLFSPGGLRRLAGPVYALYPAQVLGWGKRRVVVSAGIADHLEVYEPGVQDRISRLTETFSEETSHASQGLQSVVERAKKKAKRARSKAQILADQARERAQELSYDLFESAEYARDRARDLRDEFLEGEYDHRERPIADADRDDYRRGRVDRYDVGNYDDNANDDFDFDAPWESGSAEVSRHRPAERRSPLNLEPKLDPPSPRAAVPPTSPYATRPRGPQPPRDDDFDPWEEDNWD